MAPCLDSARFAPNYENTSTQCKQVVLFRACMPRPFRDPLVANGNCVPYIDAKVHGEAVT